MEKILIVEDREKFSVPLRKHFESQGHSVETAKTLLKARILLDSGSFDRVVTDLLFPAQKGGKLEANGMEIARLCKEKGIPCKLHSTTKNDPVRKFLFRKQLRQAKSAGFDVRPKRETMRKIRKAMKHRL